MKVSVLVARMAFSLLVATTLAQAQTYPAKPVKIIAGFPPGGAADLLARVVGDKLSALLGQTFVVENRPGAGGTIGADAVAKAAPDGYTLLLGAAASQTIAPAIYKSLPYDAAKDFKPVALVATIPVTLVVHPSVPAKSLKEFLTLARAKPGQLAYGSSGVGGSGHLAVGLLQSMTKIQLLHVPYKGNGPAIVNLMSGEVQLAFASPASLVAYINARRLRALAVGTASRSKQFPQIPTVAEAGVPGYESKSWYGFVVAAKTPQPVVLRLNKEIAQVLSRPEVIEQILTQGEAWTSSPEAFAAFIKSEHDKWGRVIKEQGITAN